MSELPNPLTPADCDLAGYRWMPLDVERVIDSDTFGLSTGDEFKTAFRLWAKSWKQVPAASLPDDDRLLAHLAGLEVAAWRKRKAVALRGWILCSDGRLYHPVIAEKALEAMGRREQHNEREDNEQSRQQRYRERRKALFETLREHGIVPSKDTKTDELERLIASLKPSPNVTQSVTGDVTGDVTHDVAATAMRRTSPDSDSKPKTIGPVIAGGTSAQGGADDFTPKDAAEWLRHFKLRHGFEADPTNANDRKKLWPVFTGWTNAGLTAGFVDKAVQSAIAGATGPISCLPLYVDRVIATMTSQKPTASDARSESRRRAYEVLTGKTGPQSDSQPAEVINGHVKLIG